MKLIILDRDGVINHDSDFYIKSPEEWSPIAGSLEAIAKLNQAGYTVAVATNQSGVGRGFYDLATLEKIHTKMQNALKTLGGKIDKIFFCPHIPDENCNCRKPKSGLYQQIAQHYNCSLVDVPAIGDSLRDIQAAQIEKCYPILVLTGNGVKTLAQNKDLQGVTIFPDLAAAVDALLVWQATV